MSEIVPVPAAPDVPQYPALGSANFNQEAYAYGSAMPAVTLRVWEIGKSAEVNSLIAKQSAEAAVPAAAAAVAARNEAVPAAAQAVAARDQVLPARDQSVSAAARAEAAAASIEDGPVTSVNGQTGVVDLTAELHALALLF